MPRVGLEIVSEGPTHCFAGVGNVLVSLYWAAPTAAALRERVGWVERVIEKHGQLGLLVVVSNDASGALPGKEFRAESRAQAERYSGKILFSATVIEGKAVHDSLARTFLRGLAVVVARDVPVRFFNEPEPAIAWAADRAATYGGPTPAEIERTLRALRLRRENPPLVP